MTAVKWFAQQLLSYKNPTNINGTDYISIPINKFEFLEIKAKKMVKEQMEISDEEILKAAKECVYEDLDISVGSFELGARWYREQLKNK